MHRRRSISRNAHASPRRKRPGRVHQPQDDIDADGSTQQRHTTSSTVPRARPPITFSQTLGVDRRSGANQTDASVATQSATARPRHDARGGAPRLAEGRE